MSTAAAVDLHRRARDIPRIADTRRDGPTTSSRVARRGPTFPAVLELRAARARLDRRRRAVPRVEAPPEPVRRVADVGRARSGARVVGFRAFLRWELIGPERAGPAHAAARSTPRPIPSSRAAASSPAHARGARRAPRRGRRPRVQHAEREEPSRATSRWGGAKWAACRPRCGPTTGDSRSPSRAPGRRRRATRSRPTWAIRRPLRSQPPARSRRCSRACHPRVGLSTRRTPEYLAWRYGNPDLGYRVVRDGSDRAGHRGVPTAATR